MALVSPGIQISINDQSQYVNSNVGSVPLVVLATAQDKTYNNAAATGTSKANAGKLQSFTSQRELVTALGTPKFQLSATGTPVNGSELNEYGLLAAYSALGVSNQMYAIRADIDLAQLTGTSIRPVGSPTDGTYWLDIDATEFGLYMLDSATSSFSHISPTLITDSTYVINDNSYAYDVFKPINSIGSPGEFALVLVTAAGVAPEQIRLYYKTDARALPADVGGPGANVWVEVGSTEWQNAIPVITGTEVSAVITNNSTLTINGEEVTLPSEGTLDISTIADYINGANITGIAASTVDGHLTIYATSDATSNGVTVDGKMIIVDGTHSPLEAAGADEGTYYTPYFFYGTYAQTPTGGWFATDDEPRPTGSVWWKTTNTGGGFNAVFKEYDAITDSWVTKNAPLYYSETDAIYALDTTGGGINITHGQVVALYSSRDQTANGINFIAQSNSTVTVGTGGQLASNTPFTPDDAFIIISSTPGILATTTTTVIISGTGSQTPQSFVAAVLAAGIPYVSARFNPDDGPYGSISFIHAAGGDITIRDTVGTPTVDAKFIAGVGSNIDINSALGKVSINNWDHITDMVKYQDSEPYTAPATGTYWYYSTPTEVDIMINNNGWKGYQNVTSDVRGYDLGNTDANGVIVSAGTAPVAQTNGDSLAAGDLWLDVSDLVNFPALRRWNGSAWIQIDNTDHTSSNGIVFADARWDTNGTTDVITGNLPTITDLLISNYIDQDAPDYRLYPRGTLLFNLRRSGYSVKQFVADKFNLTSYPSSTLPTVPGASSSLPAVKDSWVTVSGLNANGAMNAGKAAQRAIVVAAMASAIDSNTDVLEDIYNFNLLVCPGYSEVTSNLINLNNNRSNTGFIIGDTPMTLTPNAVAISNWVNNADGTGLPGVAASDPYTGIYYPAGLTNDLAGNSVVVPASHAALRTFLYSDQVSYPWFAPAGVNRGLVSNMNNIGYIDANSGSFIHNGINQGLRDALYPLKINPLTQLPGTGIVVWGQQTRSATTSSRDSINVVRLENYLRTIFRSISHGYLFEPNDTITRTSIARQIEGALNDILAKRGVYDFLVICDTSNNTSATIANKQLYVDVAIEPMRDVEFIYIPIALYNPGDIGALQIAST